MKHIACFHLFNDYSGSPKVLKQVLDGLLADGYQVELHTSRGGVLDEIEHAGIRRHSFKYQFSESGVTTMLRYTRAQIAMFFQAVRYLGRRDVDTFYINTLLPVGPALAGRLMGKRVVYHYHENAFVKSAFYRMLARAMQALAHQIICVSDYQASFLSKPEKVTVVPNALSTSFIAKLKPDAAAAYQRQRVLMLSSLKDYKGTREFIELARLLPQYKFDIVINDTQDNIDKYLQANNIGQIPENLTIYDRQPDVSSFYNNSSLVLCLTNKHLAIETFGLTALEAMSAGLPVIVPTVGGIAEMVDDGVNGYKIDVVDLNLIKDRIVKILSDEQLYASLSRGALERAKLYSADNMLKTIEKVITKQ